MNAKEENLSMNLAKHITPYLKQCSDEYLPGFRNIRFGNKNVIEDIYKTLTIVSKVGDHFMFSKTYHDRLICSPTIIYICRDYTSVPTQVPTLSVIVNCMM